MTRPIRALRETALWIAAVIGTLCLLGAVAAVAFGVTPLIFRSGSMSPGIPTGSLGIAVSTPASDLTLGDIVSTVRADGTRVTHRIVGLDSVGSGLVRLTTRGDANRDNDAETVTVAKVDRMLWSIPDAGFVLHEVTKPQWVFALGVGVGMLVLVVFHDSRQPAMPDPRPVRPAEPPPRHAARRRRSGRRGVAGVVSVTALVLAGCVFGAAPTDTLASYTDTAAVNGTFASTTLLAPTITNCTVTSNGLGIFQSVTVTWTMPSGYLKANARVGAGSSIAGMAEISPAPALDGTDPGPYSYTWSSTLLTSLLGSLLGSTSYIGVRTVHDDWISPWSTHQLTIGVLGTGATCTAN